MTLDVIMLNRKFEFFFAFMHVAWLTLLCQAVSDTVPYAELNTTADAYSLPDLPFGLSDLEPYIDAATVKVHHQGHHAAYTNKLNAALKQWRNEIPESGLAKQPILDILTKIHMVPDQYRRAIQNNGGGFVNHAIYWATLSGKEKVRRSPYGTIAGLIKKSFGSFKQFTTEFTQQALDLFGSGYVWLCWDYENDKTQPLTIVSTVNQDCPVTLRLRPLLVLDVWEHAYYLKHQNKRAEHVKDWWNVVNWEAVEELYVWWGGELFTDKFLKEEL